MSQQSLGPAGATSRPDPRPSLIVSTAVALIAFGTMLGNAGSGAASQGLVASSDLAHAAAVASARGQTVLVVRPAPDLTDEQWQAFLSRVPAGLDDEVARRGGEVACLVRNGNGDASVAIERVTASGVPQRSAPAVVAAAEAVLCP